MKDFIKKHPLLFIIIIAVLVRIPAVVWSEGYIHSDDHFDTIGVARDWDRGGFWGDDENLRWGNFSSETIARFPLYTLFLYSIIKIYHLVGITSLNTIMYGIRGIHSIISLFPVFAAFMIAQWVTGKKSWAMLAGLTIALNFSLPFLGVRNLIEVVGGNIWMLSLFFLYRYQWKEAKISNLYLAGILSGLAWMIRFQIVFAVLPIPFVLWFMSRDIKPAIHYSIGVAIMLIISGIVDFFLLGSFAATTVTLLSGLTNTPMYNTMPLIYPVELVLFLIPPISLLAFYLIFRPDFWKKHQLLFFSTMSFILFHMSLTNQQERFIMPIIPAVIILFVLAIWDKYRKDGYIIKNNKLFKTLLISSIILNFLLLAFLTPASGHYGLVRSMVWWEKQNSDKPLIVFQPHIKHWMPMEYAGFNQPRRATIRNWDNLDLDRERYLEWENWEYCFFLPKNESDLTEYLDSAQAVFGPMTFYRTFEPSLFDNLLHKLNPKYNPSYKTWVYRRTK